MQPIATDIVRSVGPRLAESLLATYAPASLIAIHVPSLLVNGLSSSSYVGILNRLTDRLVGGMADIIPAEGPINTRSPQ